MFPNTIEALLPAGGTATDALIPENKIFAVIEEEQQKAKDEVRQTFLDFIAVLPSKQCIIYQFRKYN
jgi:hypothetical protein